MDLDRFRAVWQKPMNVKRTTQRTHQSDVPYNPKSVGSGCPCQWLYAWSRKR